MAAALLASEYRHRSLIATIGDEDSITGSLLAGTGHIDARGANNFTVVDSKTTPAAIEAALNGYIERSDIAIILINQHVADMIRPVIEAYERPFPALLEIPSKDHPYDASKDTVLKKVKKMFGN